MASYALHSIFTKESHMKFSTHILGALLILIAFPVQGMDKPTTPQPPTKSANRDDIPNGCYEALMKFIFGRRADQPVQQPTGQQPK